SRAESVRCVHAVCCRARGIAGVAAPPRRPTWRSDARKQVRGAEWPAVFHLESPLEIWISFTHQSAPRDVRLRDLPLANQRERLAIAAFHAQRERAEPTIYLQNPTVRRGEAARACGVDRGEVIEAEISNESIH